ncbi:Cryptochrome-like protein cry2 [Neolewinella maritima]|uniref:Cryptochrome-like protein cry2 n=1 Tax=Neolewinella maritima TaxID=1383882 RepID=A0ABN8F6N5_9BACT|nr:FAD-binding domain-containing protein [Neolewinella maritima]CAH0999975.1 Cryptochrome-like protein cry2 [Neolewinella maritima]
MATNCIYWLKRDFRLYDNPALTAALRDHSSVMPVFILEPSALDAPETSAFHVHAQCDAFNGLHKNITSAGGTLAFAHAEVVDYLDQLHRLRPITHLVSHMETGGARTYSRDRAVASWCQTHGVEWTEYQQFAVFRGKVDRNERHKAWEAFTRADLLAVPPGIDRLRVPDVYRTIVQLQGIDSVRSPDNSSPPAPAAPPPTATLTPDKWMHKPEWLGVLAEGPMKMMHFKKTLNEEQQSYIQPVNEDAAALTLHTFLEARGINYSKGMSSPNSAFYNCSRLSVHFAWGTISVRTVYQRVSKRVEELKAAGDPWSKAMARNLRSFLSRLHWHDHFTQRLETEVEMEDRPLNPNFWELKLENKPEHLTAWLSGRTGWPMVDACMRCMATTGFMNFRMRAMITSAATHLLHLDFRSIDKGMARLYTDYEPGIHLSQLQMQAGMVGINTLRTYSPEKQLLDHDKEGTFVHRWVPELREFTVKEIVQRDPERGLGSYPPVRVERKSRAVAYKKLLNDLKYRPGGEEINQRVFAKHGSRKGPRKRPAARRS